MNHDKTQRAASLYIDSSEPDLRGELLATGAEETLSGKARRRFGAKRQNQ